MNLKKLSLIALGSLFFASCQENTPNQEEKTLVESMNYVDDKHSFAEPNEAVVKHLDLDVTVDFETKIISGTANWTIETSKNASKIIFDAYGLNISRVYSGEKDLDYKLGEFVEYHGQSLTIMIDEQVENISIDYSTSADARALQWLDAEQTATKEKPFLFTQSQAILARTWIPCQDSPGIRYTYNAKVQVPEDMIALMSASNPMEKNETGIYEFKMEEAIPSYLMALSVGDVYFKELSKRTGVYAETSILDIAASEFEDLEAMVQAAEGLYGPYAWGRYDIIVLPPSFPFGGMENPRLTFATPTILAGDKSLVSLVAHELAHSWSGNLVTNATWDDFWLNEGFTVYFEHRIMEEVYGRDYSEMLASLSRNDLIEEAANMMEEMPDDTKLKLDLDGRNPDDGVTVIPYDKGYFFLRLIEETVGRDTFDLFINNYFADNAFKVMDTEKFVALLKSDLLSQEQYESIRANEWIYETNVPDNIPTIESERFAIVENAVEEFISKGQLAPNEVSNKWSTHEWLHFIHSLPEELSMDQLTSLDEAYGFTHSGNSEISAAWFQPSIRNNYSPAYTAVENFLVRVGRRKFLTPTYKAMIESDKTEMAKNIYAKARPNYHAVSRETLDKLMED